MRSMEKIVSKSFWLKYQNRYQELGSHVCVGLDSRLDLLPPCLQKADNPIWHFNRAIIDATADYATAYKPNLAFYLADGIRGLEALYKTVSYIPSQIPVILECRGVFQRYQGGCHHYQSFDGQRCAFASAGT